MNDWRTSVNPRRGNGAVVTSELDGSDLVPVADAAVNDANVSWAPSGNSILFGTHALELWLGNSTGAPPAERLLGPPTQNALHGKWSHDGGRIAYLGCPASLCDNFDIWVMQANGTDRRRLTTVADGDFSPAFSADGKKIVYITMPGGTNSVLRVMNDDGTGGGPIPGVPAGVDSPDWEPDGDLDDDGLLDSWETTGVDVDGDGSIDLDLPAMGAAPDHRDVFVELDCMDPHCYPDSTIEKVVESFANAPVANPDNETGITLHVDNGATSTMDPQTGELWGATSESDVIPHEDFVGSLLADSYQWGEMDGLKQSHFGAERRPVFHYAISVHELGDWPEAAGLSRGSVGGASDFLISQGRYTNGGNHVTSGSVNFQANTFMHELGHNLGLGHGGSDSENYKPSYLSIMNYAFPGAIPFSGGSTLDYSRFEITINENALDEQHAFGSTLVGGNGFISLTRCPNGTKRAVNVGTGPFDWNCDGTLGALVSVNTNGENGTTSLTGQTDWDKLVYDGGLVGAQTTSLPAETIAEEPTEDERAENQQILDAGPPPLPTTPALGLPLSTGPHNCARHCRAATDGAQADAANVPRPPRDPHHVPPDPPRQRRLSHSAPGGEALPAAQGFVPAPRQGGSQRAAVQRPPGGAPSRARSLSPDRHGGVGEGPAPLRRAPLVRPGSHVADTLHAHEALPPDHLRVPDERARFGAHEGHAPVARIRRGSGAR